MIEKVTNAQLQRKIQGLENEIDALRAAMSELALALREMAEPEEPEDAETATPRGEVLTFAPEPGRGLPPLYG